MMLFYFLLPALAYGQISIYLDVTRDEPLADAGGYLTNDVTAEERKTFQIEEEQLKSYLPKYREEKRSVAPSPVAVYVGHEQNALHKKYNWRKVQRTVRPYWKVTTNEPTCSVGEPFNNQNLSVKITWGQEHNITVTDELKYRIEIPENHLSFNDGWQQNHEEKQVQKFAVRPMLVKPCTVTANVQYRVTVSGDVAADFGKKWDGHYYWAFDIANVLDSVGLGTSKVITENITVQYYKSA